MVLSLTPLSPDEMASWRELLARDLLVIERTIDAIHRVTKPSEFLIVALGIIAALLSVELLLTMVTSIPPGAAWDDLTNRGVIVTFTNIEPENLSWLLRLNASILMIEHFVELYEKLLIHSVLKIRHTNGLIVKNDPVATWYWNAEVFE